MNETELNKAVKLIRQGKLIAIPTETVYGVVADPNNPEAINTLFEIKNRPKEKAFSVLINEVSQLEDWATDIPDLAYQLAEQHWPGPLTLVLKKCPDAANHFTGGKNTIGLRIPNHPLALRLLDQLGHGLCAPSANKNGKPPPTNAEAAQKALPELTFILDGGDCDVGMASTIIDLTTDQPVIIRQGVVKL